MIGIYAPTDLHAALQSAIAAYERLDELVQLHPLEKQAEALPNGHCIVVQEGIVSNPPDWFNAGPPIWLPPVPYTPDAVLAMVFIRLHNFKAAAPLAGLQSPLWQAASQYAALLQGAPVQAADMAAAASDFYSTHNRAVMLHYGAHHTAPALDEILNAYDEALLLAGTDMQRMYATRQAATLLTDSDRAEAAIHLLGEALQLPQPHTHALHELKWARCQARLQILAVPYHAPLLDALKQELWEVLGYFEQYERTTEQGMLLIEAAQIANISESFAEALGYINKAIQLLQADAQPELIAQAQLKKGILLYTWAQHGQPQFYRGAKDALLAALQVFTRAAAPHVFADIHHYLGIIYSEIPDEVQKKSVWAGVSVASFQEALNFYNKVDYPYEFAQVCHHFGNAFTKYPAAALGDNFEKALNWYREALDVRTAEHYPLERCLTLSNYLDAAWKAGNPGDGYSEDRWQDMWERAQELKALATDEALHTEAQEWLDVLVHAKAG